METYKPPGLENIEEQCAAAYQKVTVACLTFPLLLMPLMRARNMRRQATARQTTRYHTRCPGSWKPLDICSTLCLEDRYVHLFLKSMYRLQLKCTFLFV